MQASSDVQGRAPAPSGARLCRRDRRHPPRRAHAAAPAAVARGRSRAHGLLPRALASEPLQPLSRNGRRGRAARRASRRSGLRRARRVDRRRRRHGRRRSGTGCVCATRTPRRPRSRSPTTRRGSASGTRLLERLAALAGEAGIERFVAEVLPGNVAMLKVFAGAGLEVEREIADGTVEIAFPIAATSDYVSAVDSRDHVAVVASLRPFFQPRAVAVVGASARRGTIGGELFRNVLDRRVRRRRLSREPERRAGRRRPRLRFDRGDSRRDRPGRSLPAGRARARGRGGGAARRRPRALRHLGRLCRARRGGPCSARSSCSRSCAPTARACSGRTASGSRRTPRG